MVRSAGQWLGQRLRRVALPLGCYYAVTLLLPLGNGAGQAAAFLDHAVLVIVVPLAFVVLVAASCAGARLLAGPEPLRPVPPRMSASREAER